METAEYGVVSSVGTEDPKMMIRSKYRGDLNDDNKTLWLHKWGVKFLCSSDARGLCWSEGLLLVVFYRHSHSFGRRWILLVVLCVFA
jgi:hypothetical protein